MFLKSWKENDLVMSAISNLIGKFKGSSEEQETENESLDEDTEEESSENEEDDVCQFC